MQQPNSPDERLRQAKWLSALIIVILLVICLTPPWGCVLAEMVVVAAFGREPLGYLFLAVVMGLPFVPFLWWWTTTRGSFKTKS